MNPTDPKAPDTTALLAQVDEAEALVQALRSRTALLNTEVRLRDAKIEELQGEISDLGERLDAIEKTDG